MLYAVRCPPYAVISIGLYFFMGRSRLITHIADSKAAKKRSPRTDVCKYPCKSIGLLI